MIFLKLSKSSCFLVWEPIISQINVKVCFFVVFLTDLNNVIFWHWFNIYLREHCKPESCSHSQEKDCMIFFKRKFVFVFWRNLKSTGHPGFQEIKWFFGFKIDLGKSYIAGITRYLKKMCQKKNGDRLEKHFPMEHFFRYLYI